MSMNSHMSHTISRTKHIIDNVCLIHRMDSLNFFYSPFLEVCLVSFQTKFILLYEKMYLFKPSLYCSIRKCLFRERDLKIYVCLWVTTCCHSSLHTNKIGHASTVTDCNQLFKKRELFKP